MRVASQGALRGAFGSRAKAAEEKHFSSAGIILALTVLLLVCCTYASAHRNDYLDETFVYRTLGRHIGELENWFDAQRPRNGDSFFRHSLGLEYGLTDHLMVNPLVAWDNGRNGYAFRRLRLEARYRFGEEKPHGISPAISLEYEDDRLETRRAVTPRLVLNRDFKEFNATLNLFREFEVKGTQGSIWGYSAGFRYGEERRFRYGIELKHTFGREARGLVIPQL